MKRILALVLIVSCDAQCDDRYHKAEDYKHDEPASETHVVPFVYVPMPAPEPVVYSPVIAP